MKLAGVQSLRLYAPCGAREYELYFVGPSRQIISGPMALDCAGAEPAI
jgi:hypothetical protein